MEESAKTDQRDDGDSCECDLCMDRRYGEIPAPIVTRTAADLQTQVEILHSQIQALQEQTRTLEIRIAGEYVAGYVREYLSVLEVEGLSVNEAVLWRFLLDARTAALAKGR